MENQNKTSQLEQGLEYWENEVLYFEKAKEGLQASYAIVSQMHKIAQDKVQELTPEREEVI